MNDRFVHTLWCDDIRQEVGNKPSFMGVYTGNIVLPQLPTVLPRLFLWITINASKKRPVKTLALTVERDDGTPLVEVPETPAPIDAAQPPREGATRQLAMFAFNVGPVEIPSGCKYFNVRVKTEAGELEGSKLWVDVNPAFLAQVIPGGVPAQEPEAAHPALAGTPAGAEAPPAPAKRARKRAAAKPKQIPAS